MLGDGLVNGVRVGEGYLWSISDGELLDAWHQTFLVGGEEGGYAWWRTFGAGGGEWISLVVHFWVGVGMLRGALLGRILVEGCWEGVGTLGGVLLGGWRVLGGVGLLGGTLLGGWGVEEGWWGGGGEGGVGKGTERLGTERLGTGRLALR